MKHIEPSFEYPHDPNKAHAFKLDNAQSIIIRHENKQKPAVIIKKTKKYGSSLGWGWFQLFNIFIVGLLLIGSVGLLWMMTGSELMHEGLPKYVINKDGVAGDVIFNPQLPISAVTINSGNRRVAANDQVTADPFKQLELAPLILIGQAEADAQIVTTPSSQKSESEQQAADIILLLASGELALKKVKLTTPEDDSAYYYFSQVLIIDANNTNALAGMIKIAERYANLADRDISRNQIDKARAYIKTGLKIDPNNEKLIALEKEVDNYESF